MSYVYFHNSTPAETKDLITKMLAEHTELEKKLVELCLEYDASLSLGTDKQGEKSLILNSDDDYPGWKSPGMWITSTESCQGW